MGRGQGRWRLDRNYHFTGKALIAVCVSHDLALVFFCLRARLCVPTRVCVRACVRARARACVCVCDARGMCV